MSRPSDYRCPICNAPRGFPCRNRAGRYLTYPHNRRARLAVKNPIHSTHAGVIGDVTNR